MSEDLHPVVSELLEDGKFVEWVHADMPPEAYNAYLEKAGSLTVLEEAVEIASHFKFESEALSTTDSAHLLDRIQASVDREESIKKNSRQIWYYVGTAVAACLLILVMFYLPGDDTLLETGYAQRLNYELPDGSKLVMNASTILDYEKRGYRDIRTVKLEGEAFFEVEKGEKFTVATEWGLVEVLGTSFNVFAREGQFEVYCITGKVRVSDREGDSFVILTPGQSSRLENGDIIKTSRDAKGNEWLRGMYLYENDRLIDIVFELERQFNIDISLPAHMENIRYTGFFENTDLEKALESVFWPLRLEYVMDKKDSYLIREAQPE